MIIQFDDYSFPPPPPFSPPPRLHCQGGANVERNSSQFRDYISVYVVDSPVLLIFAPFVTRFPLFFHVVTKPSTRLRGPWSTTERERKEWYSFFSARPVSGGVLLKRGGEREREGKKGRMREPDGISNSRRRFPFCRDCTAASGRRLFRICVPFSTRSIRAERTRAPLRRRTMPFSDPPPRVAITPRSFVPRPPQSDAL